MAEKLTATPVEISARNFITENYPYDEKGIDSLIQGVKAELQESAKDDKFLASFLMRRSVVAAKDYGIIKTTDEDCPKFHVPTLIAAIKKIESAFPEEERRMSLPQEIRILALAESTNIKNQTIQGRLGIGAHLAWKIIQLDKFYEELKIMPQFDKDFRKNRLVG